MNLFVVGSTNKIKIAATLESIKKFSSFIGKFEIISCETSSYEQPFDEEVQEGAILRANAALSFGKSNFIRHDIDNIYGIGIEGGIVSLFGSDYITGFCHVARDDGKSHGAWTAFLESPRSMRDDLLKKNITLGKKIEMIRNQNNWQWHGGAFGTLSAEAYTRLDAIRDGVSLALSRFFIKMNDNANNNF
ncbi:MAG: DUF84 family protein [Promethearchaeota archaeon]